MKEEFLTCCGSQSSTKENPSCVTIPYYSRGWSGQNHSDSVDMPSSSLPKCKFVNTLRIQPQRNRDIQQALKVILIREKFSYVLRVQAKAKPTMTELIPSEDRLWVGLAGQAGLPLPHSSRCTPPGGARGRAIGDQSVVKVLKWLFR